MFCSAFANMIKMKHTFLLLWLTRLVQCDHPLGNPASQNEVIAEEPNGKIDFSNAVPQADGSLCVTKVKYLEKLEKQQVKECWHQNVTSCHDTFMTEFRPIQEKVCDENFWKACKITFKEVAYNYTLETCMTPLVEKCDPPAAQPAYGAPSTPPKEVCRTWFESQCNTTYVEGEDGEEPKPSTWCEKVPKKICAPDHCQMVPGEEECHDKTISSTVVRPEEVCDLQPSTQCRLITNLVPHLVPRQVCKEIPKEVCHLKLDKPKVVKKPVTLRWCTRPKKEESAQPAYGAPQQPTYEPEQPSYQPQQPTYQPQTTPSPPPPVYVNDPKPTPSAIYYKPIDAPAQQPQKNQRKRANQPNRFRPIYRDHYSFN